ncbi:MAG: hypothetical protein LPJ87_05210 [Zoogloeaceae bacterium]|nr:hypothetical protein [Zoogloeaceae bacterium]
MQARRFPLRQGWQWVADGAKLWRRSPAILIFASFTYMLLLILLGAIPYVGQVIAYLLMPVMSLGVLNTCRAVDQGRKSGPDILFSGFRSNVPNLMAIGGIYFIGSLGVLFITSLFDDGSLMRILTGAEPFDPEADLPNLGNALVVALVLSLPVLATYWFAPVLAGWWRVPAAKAMFFSFYACLQNWRPLVAYGLTLLVMLGILPRVLIAFAGMISPLFASLLTMTLPLVLLPITFASFYANARDVFGWNQDAPPAG